MCRQAQNGFDFYKILPNPMIKVALSFYLASLMLFLTAEVFSTLSIAEIGKAFYQIGALSLLIAFSLLFLTLLLLAGNQFVRGICRYFSGIERQRRRLWFIQGKLDEERHLFFHRKLKARYFLEARKQRLLRANDRKHSRSLARAIDGDLAKIESRIPADQHKAWRRQNQDHRRRADIEGLIALQQTIMARL